MIGNKKFAQVILFSALLIVVPMFYFPARFGMELATGSFAYSMFEVVFYGFLFYIFRPGSSLLQLFAGAGLTFLYRIVMGTILGVFLSIFYSMDFSVSLALGVSRYLPAIALHILAAPFVMRPFFLAIADEPAYSPRRRSVAARPAAADREYDVVTQPYLPRSEGRPTVDSSERVTEAKGGTVMLGESDGFHRAVRYIGEHHAVLLAAVVDFEGLTMATFQRDGCDPELWAPYSLLFREANDRLLKKINDDNGVGRLDLIFGPRRLVIVNVDSVNLLVLFRHEDDELLGIRIMQAADMIRKYVSERYGHLKPSSTEERYVSNS